MEEHQSHDTIAARFGNRTCVVPVVGGTASTGTTSTANAAVFGRVELLHALRTAHSGRDDLKCACPACEAVAAWVRYKVSRDLFRATADDKGAGVRLWVQRKKYDLVQEGLVQVVRRCLRDEGGGDKPVAVAMNRDTTKDEEGRVWIGPTVLRPGDVLHMHHESHEPPLEFRLCRVAEQQQGSDPVLEPEQHANDNPGESPPRIRAKEDADDNDPTVDLSAAVLKKRPSDGSGVVLPNFGMQDDTDMEMNENSNSSEEDDDENAQLLLESQQRSPVWHPRIRRRWLRKWINNIVQRTARYPGRSSQRPCRRQTPSQLQRRSEREAKPMWLLRWHRPANLLLLSSPLQPHRWRVKKARQSRWWYQPTNTHQPQKSQLCQRRQRGLAQTPRLLPVPKNQSPALLRCRSPSAPRLLPHCNRRSMIFEADPPVALRVLA